MQHFFNGNQFFQTRDHLADIFILDICLPGIDGLALTKYLRTREESRFTPILVISSDHAIASKANKAGATVFVPKPFGLSDFLNLVNGLIDKSVHGTSATVVAS